MDMKNGMAFTLVVTTAMTVAGVLYKLQTQPPPPKPQQPVVQSPVGPEPVPPPVAPVVLNLEEAKATITEKDCQEILGWLADDAREGRMTGKQGNRDSAEFIKKKFESFGLKTSLQRFHVRRMNPGPKNEIGDDFSHNVIGVLEGETDRQIVVGGHFDHVGYGPQMALDKVIAVHNGADDNASGTTAVIEIAEAFSKMKKPQHTIVFICFSGEEMGLIGSQHYVRQLKQEEIRKIDLMVNYDMVGYLKDKNSIPALGSRAIPAIVDIISKINDKYPFKVQAASDASGNSDHASFGREGVPYVFFFTGLHNNYHRATDDADKIDYKGLAGIARFGFEMTSEFDHKESKVRYGGTFDSKQPDCMVPIREAMLAPIKEN